MKKILSDFMYWLVYECTINKPDNNIEKTVNEYLKYLEEREDEPQKKKLTKAEFLRQVEESKHHLENKTSAYDLNKVGGFAGRRNQ